MQSKLRAGQDQRARAELDRVEMEAREMGAREMEARLESELASAATAATSPWRRRLGWALAWVVITGFILLSIRTVDWARVAVEVSRLDPWWALLALALNATVVVWWTALWLTFVPGETRIPFAQMFGITSLTLAIMNTAPLLVGHATGVGLMVKRAGLRMHSALSVMALDQLAEGICKVAVMVTAALLLPIPDWLRRGVIGVAVAVGLLLVVLLAIAHGWDTQRIHASKSPRVARIITFVQNWARDLEALRSWRKSGLALVFAFGMKAAEGLGIVAVQHAMHVHLPIETTFVVLAAVMLATMIPLSPGNLGPYEAAMFVVYRALGLSPAHALSVALIQHLAFLVPAVGMGYLWFSVGAGGRARLSAERLNG